MNVSGLRADFVRELELQVRPLGLDGLDQKAKDELKRLQGAAEGFEAHFVKQLLGQMRQSSFAEKDSQTASLAKDLMDQQVAEQTAKSGSGLGIARMVFAKMGAKVVRQTQTT